MTEIPIRIANNLLQIARRQVDPIVRKHDYLQLASMIIAKHDEHATYQIGSIIYENAAGLSVSMDYSLTQQILPELVTIDEQGNQLYQSAIAMLSLDIKSISFFYYGTELQRLGNFSPAELENILKDNLL